MHDGTQAPGLPVLLVHFGNDVEGGTSAFGRHSAFASQVSAKSNICWSLGTSSRGTQRPRVAPCSSQQPVNTPGGCTGPRSPGSEHAPDASPENGSKHGAQRSLALHVELGSTSAWLVTSGKQVDKQ